MTTDDQASWITLTQAAERSGYSREALRLRVRRGKLRAQKGRNDGQIRVSPDDLADLPPLPAEPDRQDEKNLFAETTDSVLALLADTRDDLRTEVERLRIERDKLVQDRLADHGRAERAEEKVQALLDAARIESARTSALEARLSAAEAALAEARTPLLIRVLKALRREPG